MEIKEQKPVPWAEAKRMLEEKEKQKELGYEQKNALEHLRKFSKLSAKKAEEMAAELAEIRRLRDRHIIAIIDHLPEDLDDLRVLLSGQADLTPDEKKKVLDTVKKFA
jgi:DNA-directed RNA polymerase subunit F